MFARLCANMLLGVADECADRDKSRDAAIASNPSADDPAPKPEVLDKASELLRPLLRDPSQAPKTAEKLVAVMETHTGPLPHPRILSLYQEVIPGAAREILDMAREEQRHRHRMENRETAYPYVGMGLGGLCLLSCIVGAVFVAVHAYSEKIGLALIGAPVLTGVGWFINARSASMSRPLATNGTPQRHDASNFDRKP
jgi:uncharacterized membrane protein